MGWSDPPEVTPTLTLSVVAVVQMLLLPRAEMICCTELQRWLFIAVTLERLSFADGLVLARTWNPTVSKQPEFMMRFS